jgi:hypothetical protein
MKAESPKERSFRFTSVLERSENKLWGCHFRVPVRMAKELIDSSSRRVICTLNNSVPYQCAILHRGEGLFLITVNKGLREKLGLEFGMEIQVGLKKDRSEYGLPMPEELQELLHQDTEGKKLFHALTRGKQRTLLYIIGSAKSSPKRISRAIIIVKHLKSNRGNINYRQLYTAMKDPRISIAK